MANTIEVLSRYIVPSYNVSKDVTEKGIWCYKAMMRPDNVTLAQEMHAIANSDDLREDLLDKWERVYWEGVVTTTGVLYEKKGEKIIERPEKVYMKNGLWTFDIDEKTNVFEVKLPKTSGYVIPFTNDRFELENVYDFLENGGFPREVVGTKREAEKKLEQVCVSPKFVSYFSRRDQGNSGLACVFRYTRIPYYGPLHIDAGGIPNKWYSFIGIRLWSGLEKAKQTATIERNGNEYKFKNADDALEMIGRAYKFLKSKK